MKLLAILLFSLMLSGCAPLVIGVAAGLVVSEHERHRAWCIHYYGNPECWHNGHPTAYTYRMPMGVQR